VIVESVSLGVHLLTSSGEGERQEFLRAPFRYPASDDALLSNNLLEVGDNFLGLAVGLIRFIRGGCQQEPVRELKEQFSFEAKLNRNYRVKLQ
jgi:hypothetical protein